MDAGAKLIVLTVWASALASGTASAGIVFEQDPQLPTMQSPWSSTCAPTANPMVFTSLYTTYDNFSVAKAATVTDLNWQGFSFDANTLGATSLPIEGFRVSFYSNSAGQPGAMISSQTIGFTGLPSGGSIDVFGNGQTETIENDSGTLSTGFVAAAGTTYWLSIQAVMESPAIWMWASGTGGDGTSYQVASAREGGGSFVRPGDRSFTLASVPGPSSLVLSGVAVWVGLVGFRLRRPPCKPISRDG